MIQFYTPDIISSHALSASDSQHCVRVLRHREGDEIEVIDGTGGSHRCVIIEANPHRCQIEILSSRTVEKPWDGEFVLAVAPTKLMDRMEWMVEKAVEIGVDRIVPVLCHNSERRVIKTERLIKTAISAMKQSLKATLPVIDELTPFDAFVRSCVTDERFIAYCDADTPRAILPRLHRPGASATVLVGPEGDFSPAEVSLALQCGFRAVTLGDCRLRTETAAIASLMALHTVNQLADNS